jgi:predicted DNA-binding transcriptional regulator YafY
MKITGNPPTAGLAQAAILSKQFPPELLLYWLARPRNPVFASSDPLTKMLIRAMLSGKPASFIYTGGSTPGSTRLVNISLVFQHEPAGRIYVAGFCQSRRANRIFALDLIMVVHARN